MRFAERLFAVIVALVCVAVALRAEQGAIAQPASAAVEQGEINGARFRIELPADWNRGLVLYTHGYQVAGDRWNPGHPAAHAFRRVFLSRGFAFAESAYSAQGWAVKEAIEDTEALRRYFVAKYGKPGETYITGHSIGGHIAVAIVERYPDVYQGAMPMCGPLGPAVNFLHTTVFDMLVTFEALFPGTIGSPYEPSHETAAKVKAAIATDPARAARYAARVGRPVDALPSVLALYHTVPKDLKERAGGEPFDNRNRIYSGFGDDAALNRRVKRYAADPAALEYLRLYASPTGRTSDPILTIQTTADALITGEEATAYEKLAMRAGTTDRFVARFVEGVGHCNFTPEQVGTAFDALLSWVRDGKRPSPGEQK